MSNLLGVIRAVIGQVYVVEADGSQRLLKEGDRIYSGEEIVTGDSGAVSVSLPDGKTLDLGRNSHWTEQGLHAVNSAEHNTLDIASAQKAIADGADPTHTLEATAAGNEPPVNIEGGGGGHTLVQLDLTGQIISPIAGFPTAGPGSTAPDIIHFDTFNPPVHDARNPENNVQNPIATENITATDLVVATQTVAFTELTPATNTVPLTELIPAESPTPLTQLVPAEPPTPLTQLTPAEPPTPLTQLTPAEPPMPLTQLIPAEPPMPFTQLTPAEPPMSLTQLTPAEPPTPLTQLIPAEPPTPLTQLTPAEPPMPLTQLTPAEPPMPLTQLTPAEPPMPLTQLTPAEPPMPLTQLTPAEPPMPLTQLIPAEPPMPLTQLTPAEPPTPLTQLIPAETPTPLTQLTPAEPPTPLTQLTPAEPTTPLTQLTPAEPPTPLTQLIPAEPPTPITQLTPAEPPTPLTQLTPAEPPTPLTQLTPAEPPTQLTQLIPAEPPTPLTQLTPAEPPMPLTQLTPAEPPMPLTQLTPAEPPMPLTQLIPAEPPMPLTQLTPAEPPMPLTQLTPAEPPMPLTQLTPAEPPMPLTQLTPAEPPMPLTQLTPAEPPMPLTQLTPAEPPMPLTQLTPAEPPTPLTQLTPAEPPMPLTQLTPAEPPMPLTQLTPAEPATHTVPASVLTPATHTVPASILTPATHTAQASLAHVDVNIDLREVPPDTSGSDVIKVNGGSEDPDGFDVKDGKIVAIGKDVRIWLSEGDEKPTCADPDHQIMHYSNGNPGGDSSYSDVFVVHKGSGYTQDGNHRDLDSVHGNTQPQSGADSHKDYIFVQTEVGVTPEASHQTDNRNHNVNTLDGVKVTYTNADGQHGSYFGQSSNQIEGVIFGDGKTHIASDADTTLKHVTPPPAAHDYIIDVTATLTDDNTSDSLSKITLEGLPKGTEIMDGDKVVYTVGDDGKYVIDGSGHGSRWDDHITIRVHGDDKPIITGHGTYEHHDPAPPPAPAADDNSAQHHAADLAAAHNAPDVHHKYSASILGNHENNDLNMDTLLHAGKVNQGKSADAAITHSHEADKIDLSALATELEKGSDDVSQLIVTDDHHSNALAVPVASAPVMASTAGYEHHAALSPSIDHLLHQPEHHSY